LLLRILAPLAPTDVHAYGVARVHGQVRYAWLAGSSACAAVITVSPGANAAAAMKNALFASGLRDALGSGARDPARLRLKLICFSRFARKQLS
jgi:hypothetical protein